MYHNLAQRKLGGTKRKKKEKREKKQKAAMECKEKARGGIMGVGDRVVNGEMNWTHCHACVLGGKSP